MRPHLPRLALATYISFPLEEEVRRRDLHSAKISENRVGILKGASVKRALGVISDIEVSEITAIVDAAQPGDFAPLLYVIPHEPVM